MKKIVVAAWLVLGGLVGIGLPASGAVRAKVGVSASYYAPKDVLLKDIYGPGGLLFEGNGALLFADFIEIRAEFGQFKDRGAMTASGEDLSLTLSPFLIAIRLAPIEAGRFRPFVGVGVGTLSIKEDYPERISDVSKSTGLSMFEAGFYFVVTRHIQLDASLRFLNAKSGTFDPAETIRLGGIRTGFGVSYSF